MVQRVEMLSEVQDKRVEGLNIQLQLDTVNRETIDELTDIIKANKGTARLHVSVYNPMNRQQVSLTSRSNAIRVSPAFYKWLCNKRSENMLDFNVVTKE